MKWIQKAPHAALKAAWGAFYYEKEGRRIGDSAALLIRNMQFDDGHELRYHETILAKAEPEGITPHYLYPNFTGIAGQSEDLCCKIDMYHPASYSWTGQEKTRFHEYR